MQTRNTILADIDGTIADTSRRLNHLPTNRESSDNEYAAFHADCVNDPPIPPLCEFVTHLLRPDGPHVMFVTTRPETVRPQTQAWLLQHLPDLSPDSLDLHMRPAGDRRPDHAVKKQLLKKTQLSGIAPTIAIEDRPRVQSMYHRQGLRILDPGTWARSARDPAFLAVAISPAGAPLNRLLADSAWLRETLACTPDSIVPATAIREQLALQAGHAHSFKQPHPAEDDIVSELCRSRILCGLPPLPWSNFPPRADASRFAVPFRPVPRSRTCFATAMRNRSCLLRALPRPQTAS